MSHSICYTYLLFCEDLLNQLFICSSHIPTSRFSNVTVLWFIYISFFHSFFHCNDNVFMFCLCSPTRSPVLNSSSEETVKDASQLADYANESFDSVDQTLTQAKSATPSPLRTTESNKSSPSPGLLSPNRRRQDPESGSESERSLSQTFSG